MGVSAPAADGRTEAPVQVPVFFASMGVMSGNGRKGSGEPFARFQDAGTNESTAGGEAVAVGISGDVRELRHGELSFQA